tara:strand:+ start:443 stop:667 length:225 start_codon:yes stop_codon:yes gene_type:complete
MNILILGGARYVGTNLSNKLSRKHKVMYVDAFWFDNHLDNSVSYVKTDIRNFDKKFKPSDINWNWNFFKKKKIT